MKNLSCILLILLAVGGASAVESEITRNLPDSYEHLECITVPCTTDFCKAHRKALESYVKDHAISVVPSYDHSLTHATSSNWSGYLVETLIGHGQAESVTQISASWIIPEVLTPANPSNSFASSSPWIGIDGWDANSHTIEQIGTDSDWLASGRPNYYVWFEMYPVDTVVVLKADGSAFPIQPGDLFSAEVIFLGRQENDALFLMSIVNHTKQVYAIVNLTNSKTSDSPIMTSAEWIVEAESSGNGYPLANFGTLTFTDCYTTVNGVYGPINDSNWDNAKITMTGHDGDKVLVSELDSSGTSFTITWLDQD